jgi:hypothetical protein
MSEPTPSSAPAPGAVPGRDRSIARWVALAGGLGGLLVVGLVGWLRPSPGRPARVGPVTLTGTSLAGGSPFVGSRACRECHPGEYAAHSRSGHARTLKAAGASDVARRIAGRVVDDPERPGVRWSYRIEGGTLVAQRDEGRERARFPLEYALGSGQHAVTFVSLVRSGAGPPAGLEHRLTYFAREDALRLTPGQVGGRGEPGLTSAGFRLPPRVVLDCFECHGTRTASPRAGGLAPETLIPNISCERCHGPGRAHVEAAGRGQADPAALAMPFGLGRGTAESQLNLCGRCHRLPGMVPAGTIRPDNARLARFPSVGLSQSACYRRSRGALSCTTCHDPHGRAEHDPAPYEAACRSCHADPGDPRPSSEPAVAAAPCPVDPRARCVACHMPRRDVGHGLDFSDHWIRVPDPAPPREPASGEPR